MPVDMHEIKVGLLDMKHAKSKYYSPGYMTFSCFKKLACANHTCHVCTPTNFCILARSGNDGLSLQFPQCFTLSIPCDIYAVFNSIM